MTAIPVPKEAPSFTSITRDYFKLYQSENPNKSRVTQSEREEIIAWLTDPSKHPSSQREFSRRNYVQSTFSWDEATKRLFARPKSGAAVNRLVVSEDMIIDAVEYVHIENEHAGWDGTWKAISTTYYGVPRADVVFLLKRCEVCCKDPCKRPKRFVNKRTRQTCQYKVHEMNPLTEHGGPSDDTSEAGGQQDGQVEAVNDLSMYSRTATEPGR